ncbi:MAG: pyrroline-5-carboxylate reductase [Ruminococcaceae bacterium]|nr:pyrroline-5-carboxylate reductase [Oscillospiraceae bacterium]
MKIGIIGAGNMSTAIMKGLIGAGKLPSDIFVSDISAEKLSEAAALGVHTGTNEEAAEFGDAVILAVKPNIFEKALPSLADLLKGKLVISIAAGITIGFISSLLPGARIVRLMPNTPALVGAGMTAISFAAPATQEDANTVEEIFSALGKCVQVPESLMDAVVAVSGSGPAYAYMLIDAMASGGVARGLTKKDALLLAAQTVYGAAKMVLETGEHPAVLCDNVCSPGGTTIAAVEVLEAKGFRTAIMEAEKKCAEKSAQLKK